MRKVGRESGDWVSLSCPYLFITFNNPFYLTSLLSVGTGSPVRGPWTFGSGTGGKITAAPKLDLWHAPRLSLRLRRCCGRLTVQVVLGEWRGLTQGVTWLRIRAFARHPFGFFLATLSIISKSLLVLNLGTLTPSDVNKYSDSVMEYRYIYSTTGYLQGLLFPYNDKKS